MGYRYIFTAWFDRNLKSLRKHNPSLRSDFESFLQNFDAEAHPIIRELYGLNEEEIRIVEGEERG
ncbi:MAG: hypothetical protein IT314_09910 [Anaerolineales bacterium]|nr:hypothetical protein [Anaerolineales bacterium]